jgi:hypothetical protein
MKAYPFFAKYGKTIVAFLLPVYSVVVAQYTGDHHIDPTEAVIIATAIVNGVLVYFVPMAPGWKWGKSVLGAVLAGLVAFAAVIGGGIDLNGTYLVIGAIVTALGIPLAPAVSVGAGKTEVGTGPDVIAHLGADRS